MFYPTPAVKRTVVDDDEDEFLEDENEDWGGEEDDGEELQEDFSKVAFRMVCEVDGGNKEEGDIVCRMVLKMMPGGCS